MRLQAAAAASVLMVFGLAACGKPEDASAPPVRPVLSVVAEARAARSLAYVGAIEPQFTTNIGFQLLGRLISREVEVGDLVRAGQRVAALDPVALEFAVRASRAALASAQAQLTNAASAEARLKALQQGVSTTQASLDAAEQARQAAEAAVARAQANLAKANEQLGYAERRAPYDGVVTAVGAEVGQIVSLGETVVTIAKPDPRDAVVDIPDWLGVDLKIGARFLVALQLDPSITAHGVIREIAPQADAATRSRRVKIGLTDPPDTFRLGATVLANIDPASMTAIALPRGALFEADGKTMVWIVNPQSGSVSKRQVEVAAATDAVITLASGVEPGEHVVTAGVHSLADGQRVKMDKTSL